MVTGSGVLILIVPENPAAIVYVPPCLMLVLSASSTVSVFEVESSEIVSFTKVIGVCKIFFVLSVSGEDNFAPNICTQCALNFESES